MLVSVLVSVLVINVFQYWLKVTSVNGLPADDVNKFGMTCPVP